ncbi:MAG: response regulator [Lachnospiraceae bacterium]|nr:response regulator [Lachnospiraceae bacterium]
MKVTKIIKKIPWIILLIQLLIIIYAVNAFKVDDTTLYKGDIDDFNTGWTLTREDGTESEIELPYYEDCEAGKRITISNVIPEEYWGKTIRLLTADKEMRVIIDGTVVYEFGIDDERTFGQTPGSVTNFIDIPSKLQEGSIVIELTSPYENYGACIDSITIAERDIAILDMLIDNVFDFGCGLIMLLVACGFLFILLMHMIVRKKSKIGSNGTEYLAAYCFLSFIYYIIETKAMHLFYGNQTLYSVTIFLILMSLPLLLTSYCIKRFNQVEHVNTYVVAVVAAVNACVQMVMQLLNIADFMDLAFVSHGILFAAIIVIMWNIYKMSKRNREVEYYLEFAAMLILGICGVCDIVRSYTLTWEHIPKLSRYGTTVFCLLMIVAHILYIMRRYANVMEENSKLLQQKIELAEKKNQAKTIFLARMSHEIRTPINAVMGMNKMILSETKENNIREYAEEVEDAAQALLGRINEILDLSKIETGKMSLNDVEYNTKDLLYHVSDMTAVRAQAKDLIFKVEVDEDIPTTLRGDDAKLGQVLTNLLSNAVKYTDDGLVELTVKCDKAPDGKSAKLHITISDTGIGIKDEELRKFNELIENLEDDNTRIVEEVGLGISITAEILKLMNSQLYVDSKYGEGSTFSFTVEQPIADATPIGDFDKDFRNRRHKYEQCGAVNAVGHKVLVIDDNNINRRIFVSLMKNTGIQVVEAASGKEGIELVTKEMYDIIFLDHMMPGMDGIETLRVFKESEENLNTSTPVIAVTANAVDGAKEYYLGEGFDGYIAKPIDSVVLDNLIKQYIQ